MDDVMVPLPKLTFTGEAVMDNVCVTVALSVSGQNQGLLQPGQRTARFFRVMVVRVTWL